MSPLPHKGRGAVSQHDGRFVTRPVEYGEAEANSGNENNGEFGDAFHGLLHFSVVQPRCGVRESVRAC